MKRINGRAIIIDGDEVLLMFRRKIKDGIVNEYYAIPGGGKEENETMSKQIETLSSELESCKNECEEKDKMLSECKEKLESYAEREKEQMYSEMLSELKEFAKANHMSEEDFAEAQEKTKEFSSKDEFMKFVVFSQYTKNKANKSNDFVNMGGCDILKLRHKDTQNREAISYLDVDEIVQVYVVTDLEIGITLRDILD